MAAMLIHASRTYFKTYHDAIGQPDPIQMNVHYLHLIPPGIFNVQFEDLKLSQRHSTIQAKITSPLVKNATICTLAIFTMGDLNTNLGISLELPPIPTPDRERECARWTNALFYKSNPPTASVRYYNPKDGKSLLWSPKGGQNARDQWGKLDSGDKFRLEHLGLMADLVCVPKTSLSASPVPILTCPDTSHAFKLSEE